MNIALIIVGGLATISGLAVAGMAAFDAFHTTDAQRYNDATVAAWSCLGAAAAGTALLFAGLLL